MSVYLIPETLMAMRRCQMVGIERFRNNTFKLIWGNVENVRTIGSGL